MSGHSFSSLPDQIAEILLNGIRERRWCDVMPGRVALARELGVNHKTVETALKALEKVGWLEKQGLGRGRKINLLDGASVATLRIKILLYEKCDHARQDMLNLLHSLQEAGHLVSFAETTMRQLGMNVGRIARFVEKTGADAWIVVAGPSDVMDWFATRSTPVFALYGDMRKTRMASTGPRKHLAQEELMERLVSLGHRRIVMLVREERSNPIPNSPEQLFLDHLESRGISTSAYNLPNWGDTPEEFHHMIDSLFRHTPPTALIIDEVALFFATLQHLARIGIVAPDHISMVCTDPDPIFEWCRPTITHFAWDSGPLVKRVVNWANNVSRGKDDRRKSVTEVKFVIGGTIGPVPKAR
jgi:DNA-binding LacI/PurR family transcriptional regulator